jgi:hypothetical protein
MIRNVTRLMSLLFIVIAFSSAASAADSTAADSVASEGVGFWEILYKVPILLAKNATASVTKNLYSSGIAIGVKLIPGALALGGSLALCYLFVEVIKAMTGGKRRLIDVIVDVALPCAIAGMLINGYSENMDRLNNTFDLLRMTSVVSDPITAIGSFYGSIFTMIGNVIITSIKSIASWGFFTNGIVSTGLNILLTLLFAGLIFILAFKGIVDMLTMILMGPFLFAVGAAFGPVFVATLVTPWSRDYFGKWFGFLAAAAVLTGVVAVVVSVVGGCLDALDFNNFATKTDDNPISIQLAVMAVILRSMNGLIKISPSIASALVPGSIGTKGLESKPATFVKVTPKK